ncbi:restriction endonuclease subunit S [Chishuiella sp.]|uniref:restriction endonuclease subunit S n=1 Tax=Chishuiella sp. TaxID=1969467 RepID=UPI0028AF321A|nr:restriction endonuclease subunit S [Chishuiella sp.]
MESYLDWINKVSSDTKIVPLYFVADFRISPIDKIKYEHETPVKLCNYVDVYKNTYISTDIDFMEGTASENEVERFTIKDGDIMITKDSESSDDIGIPAIVKGDFEELTVCGYHLALITPDREKVVPKFLFYCFESKQHRLQIEIESTGVTRVGIPKDVISHYKIPLKSLTQQNKIVAYLDQEVAKIDALIEKKSRLVELLEEKKKATISQAVTKGLNLKAKLKSSGIDWLGDIPEHWEIVKLKYISNLKSGDNLTADDIKSEGDFKVFGGNGIRGFYDKFNHEGNLVLIGRQGALCGNINFAEDKFWATEHAIVCNPLMKFDYYWLGKLLEYMNLNQYSLAAAQPGLSVDVIKNLEIPFPIYSEQKLISQNLVEIDNKNNHLISKINNSIDLLKEKRTAIISAAINGEINL